MYKSGVPIVVVYQANNSATGKTIAMDVYDETYAKDAGKSVVAMTEMGTTGRYYASFTPDAEGEWVAMMYDSEPPAKGHAVKAFRVVGHDIDSVGDTIEAVGSAVVTSQGEVEAAIAGAGASVEAALAVVDSSIQAKLDMLDSPPMVG